MKQLAFSIIVLLGIAFQAKSFTLIGLTNCVTNHDMNCDYHIVMIPENVHQNIASAEYNFTVTNELGSTFNYLYKFDGSDPLVQLQSTVSLVPGSSTPKHYIYKLYYPVISIPYQEATFGLYDVSGFPFTPLPPDHFFALGNITRVKANNTCSNECKGNILMQTFYLSLHQQLLNAYGYDQNFMNLSNAQKNRVRNIFRVALNDPTLTTADLNFQLNPLNANQGFGDQSSSCTAQTPDCACLNSISNFLEDLNGSQASAGLSETVINYIENSSCFADYCWDLDRTEDAAGNPVFIFSLFPGNTTGNFYLLTITVQNGQIVAEMAYSDFYTGTATILTNPNVFNPFLVLDLNPGTVQFDADLGFSFSDEWTEIDGQSIEGCIDTCESCVGSFALIPGQRYLITAWTKEDGAPLSISNYDNPEIYIDFTLNGGGVVTVGPFKPDGQIIDFWQRIEQEFDVPSNAISMSIRLESVSGDVYFDDIRILPFDASMKTYVYDPQFMRLAAELDERHYATFYEYDEEGKLIRIKKETEKGIMTIQETRNNNAK